MSISSRRGCKGSSKAFCYPPMCTFTRANYCRTSHRGTISSVEMWINHLFNTGISLKGDPVGIGESSVVYHLCPTDLPCDIVVKVIDLKKRTKNQIIWEYYWQYRAFHAGVTVRPYAVAFSDTHGFLMMDNLVNSTEVDIDDAENEPLIRSILKTLHNVGIMHNDVHEGNLLQINGKPLLIDFGLATALAKGWDGDLGMEMPESDSDLTYVSQSLMWQSKTLPADLISHETPKYEVWSMK